MFLRDTALELLGMGTSWFQQPYPRTEDSGICQSSVLAYISHGGQKSSKSSPRSTEVITRSKVIWSLMIANKTSLFHLVKTHSSHLKLAMFHKFKH